MAEEYGTLYVALFAGTAGFFGAFTKARRPIGIFVEGEG